MCSIIVFYFDYIENMKNYELRKNAFKNFIKKYILKKDT